jgi:hypothetical protein
MSEKLDLCFVCDTTGSMSGSISTVQKHLKAIAEAICASEKRDLQLACVEYKDHCDPIVVDSSDFTGSVSKLKHAVDKWKASGGGDHAECIADGLHAASKLNWREDSTKILVLCADAPPHGVGDGSDNHPNGCPLGLDPLKLVRRMVKREIIIYTVGVNNPNTHTVSFLCTISRMTGGRYLPLAQAESLPTILMGGAEEELELAKFEKQMEEEEKKVLADAAKNKEELTEEQVHRRIADNMASRNVRTKKVVVGRSGGGDAWRAQEDKLSKAKSLSSYQVLVAETDYSDAPVSSTAHSSRRASDKKERMEERKPSLKLMSSRSSSVSAPSTSSRQKVAVEEDVIDYEQVSRVMKKKAARKE